MKKIFMLLTVTVLFAGLLSGCYLVNGLLLSDESSNMIGLWAGEGWNDVSHTCYYDFRDDGRVFVTEWTDDLETVNNWFVPNYFKYSVKDNILKMKQFAGLIYFEFEMVEDISSPYEEAYLLYVNEESSDYEQLDSYNTLSIHKVDDYSTEAKTVRAYIEGFDYE